jgi:hypothetical protein
MHSLDVTTHTMQQLAKLQDQQTDSPRFANQLIETAGCSEVLYGTMNAISAIDHATKLLGIGKSTGDVGTGETGQRMR